MKMIFLAFFLCGPFVSAFGNGQANPRSIWLPPEIDSLISLQQNWTNEESNHFYNTPQGSRLLPYDLFIHLEKANSEELFRSSEHMHELGYIPREKSSHNPDGLPIGFIKDAPYNEEIPGLGLTCAACHTGLIVHDKTAYIVDGAPAMADFESFLRRLESAISETLNNEDKFNRLVANVLPENPSPHLITNLRNFIQLIANERSIYNKRNLPTDDSHRYGFARVDAFGAIFNQVSAHFLDIPENAKVANAPVSYPSLWDTPQHDRVQWNGAAKNKIKELGAVLFGTEKVGALGRNAGEVLGVFGNVEVNETELILPRRYNSTVEKEALIEIEDSIEKLWSPVWPFSSIEKSSAIYQRGEAIYKERCLDCHKLLVRDDPSRKVKAKMVDVSTDQTLIENFLVQRKTGRLQGRLKTISERGRFQEMGSAGAILGHVVERAILNPFGLEKFQEIINGIGEGKAGILNPSFQNTAIITIDDREYKVPFDKIVDKLQSIEVTSGDSELFELLEQVGKSDKVAQLQQSSENNSPVVEVLGASVVFAYKARPLNGVWATAPFLHNGSVISLTDLLKAVPDRKQRFHVGSTVFDTENVGFVDDPSFPVLDTSLKGNYNIGHEYGVDLSPLEKTDLIHYVKSL